MSSLNLMEQDTPNVVKVHSMLTIVSSTPVKKGRVCPLSPLDHAMAHHTLHVIFYYRSGPFDFDLDRIRPPLNEVLSLYPTVTGRLARDDEGNWLVKCTDAGVRTYLANASVTLDEWLTFSGAHHERFLCSWEDVPQDPHIWSPFRIQITEFECGGRAVALSCPHMLADPTSVTLFIKTWTDALHCEPISHLPSFLHPLALQPPPSTTTMNNAASSLHAFYSAKSAASQLIKKLPEMASATFCFSDSTIRKSLSEIRSTVPHVTPFDLLAALFWSRIARLKNVNHKETETETICVCTDMRKYLRASLPRGHFGNTLHFSQLKVGAQQLESGDLCQVAGLVHRHVAGSDHLEQGFWSAVDWFGSSRKDGRMLGPPFRMYGPELTCVNMEDMFMEECGSQPLMYMAEFIKGEKPVHVSYHVGGSEGEGLVLVMLSPEERLARRVAVLLPQDKMERLMEDKLVLALEPTFILSGAN